MKLKKIALAALLFGTLATSASAGGINYSALGNMHGSVDYGMMTLDGTNVGALNYDFGFTHQAGDYVFGFDYMYETPTDSNYVSFGSIEANFGYRFIPKLTTYGLVSYDYESSVADGVGFGVGAKYQLIDYIAVTAKYKHTSMSPIFGDSFSKDIATVGLELNFNTADGNQKWQR